MHHKDPFDRMIAAQALSESMPVVSIDAALDLYGIARLW
jgi:PIN domain nuclease of toxin-antitoxin system